MVDGEKEIREMRDFIIEGVLLSLVVCLGLAGNFTSFLTLRRQVIQRIFHNLLFLLSIFDTIYLMAAVVLFVLPNVETPLSLMIQNNTLQYVLPIAHIGMIGSMFTSVAMSLERYLAVVHPFARIRHNYSSRHFIIPVVLYSILYNIPKFWEIFTICKSSKNEGQNTTVSDQNCTYQDRIPQPSELRTNYWYLTLYCLWINTIFNLILPIFCLIFLNVIIFRKIKAHSDHLDQNYPYNEKMLRKREVLISKISISIVFVIVICHSMRLVPSIWEICQTFLVGRNSEMFEWPLWVDTTASVAHLALAVSCSISFYIYRPLYRNIRRPNNTLHPNIRFRLQEETGYGINSRKQAMIHTGSNRITSFSQYLKLSSPAATPPSEVRSEYLTPRSESLTSRSQSLTPRSGSLTPRSEVNMETLSKEKLARHVGQFKRTRLISM